jgi:hypothetical protein
MKSSSISLVLAEARALTGGMVWLAACDEAKEREGILGFAIPGRQFNSTLRAAVLADWTGAPLSD